MLYVSFGLEKAGSTLTYSITRALLEHAGHRHIVLAASDRQDLPEDANPKSGRNQYANNVNTWCEAEVRAAEAAAPAGGILTLRTHAGPDESIARAVEDGRALVHVAIRDIRDVALSINDAVARKQLLGKVNDTGINVGDFRSAFRDIEENLRSLDRWADMPGTLVLHYENTAFAPALSIDAICRHLNLDIAPSQFEAIFDKAAANPKNKRNVAESRRHTREMSAEDQAMILDHFAAFYDRYMPDAAVEVDNGFSPRSPEETAAAWLRQNEKVQRRMARKARLTEQA